MAPSTNQPVAVAQQVSYYYPKAKAAALFDIDLTIERGDMVGIIGATGSGKTTLCLALNGIVPQFYGGRFFGSLTVNGLDSVDTPIHTLAQRVSIVFQDPSTQMVTSSVENEVAFALENQRHDRGDIRTRVDEALAAVHLDHIAKKHPHDLSGGQQQRLALAAAFAQRPGLIVLDEPTSQLDPRSTEEVFELAARINRDHGTAFVITGHEATHMATFTRRIVLLSGGRIVADGTPQDIYGDHARLAAEKLRPPDVTSLFVALGQRGIPVEPPLPIQLDDATERLATVDRPAKPPAITDPAFSPAGVPVLSLRNVHYAYPDGTEALKGIDLDIHRKDYTLVVGQNGSGKSTMLKHLLNLLAPTKGEVLIDGTPLTSYTVSELARRIGYIPQNPDRQIFNTSVEAEVAFSLRQSDLKAAEKARRVDAVLDALNLQDIRKAHPFSLAKGDRARVVMAAVLIMDPEIMVFDEPTTGQDDAGSRAILDFSQKLHAEGRTVIVVTHHLNLMPGYARRAIVMGEGRVLLDAPLREAYHNVPVLEQTFLRPTQIVSLAKQLEPARLAVSIDELADAFAPANGKGIA